MTDIEDNIERSKSVLALVQDQFTATDRQKLSDNVIYFSLDAVERELDYIAEKHSDLRRKEREQATQIAALSEILLSKAADLILDFAALSDENKTKALITCSLKLRSSSQVVQIERYDFKEGFDFCLLKNECIRSSGFQPINYFISIDMAKELSMVGQQ